MSHRFGCVIDHATGGKLSKTTYPLDVYYREIDEASRRNSDSDVAEAVEDKDAEIERLRGALRPYASRDNYWLGRGSWLCKLNWETASAALAPQKGDTDAE